MAIHQKFVVRTIPEITILLQDVPTIPIDTYFTNPEKKAQMLAKNRGKYQFSGKI